MQSENFQMMIQRLKDEGVLIECGVYWHDRGSEPGRSWDVEHVTNQLVPTDAKWQAVYRVNPDV